MSDWYSRAREADGRTDDEVMSEVKLREDAADFWAGKCRDCGHPEHEMTCHEPVYNGDPSNGPAYCPCAVQIENMEMEVVRLRDLVTKTVALLRAASLGDGRDPAVQAIRAFLVKTGYDR